ncbi:MAG: hypothetical protein LUG51_06675 [Tannerellaceae bacterium]|nr:hypothetical protein [Tannerellaceae bacterium]
MISKSPNVCYTVTKWFNLWMHSSTLISQTGLHIRQQFMEEQYRAVKDFKAYIGI